ncbi:MAG: PHP domain-containing protein [Candidatus Rokubacteria bacterium]|nr:PHP domain-containing protein [Candidatus Rokubacteria bacterium]
MTAAALGAPLSWARRRDSFRIVSWRNPAPSPYTLGMSAWALILSAAAAWGLDGSLNLHNHTYCSDGSDTPEAFIELANRSGVRVVAVTDHDTVACVERAVAAGRKAGIRVVAGIELSVEDDSMHILGLNIDPGSPRLSALMDKNRKARLDRAREMIAKLNTLTTQDGVPIQLALREVLLLKVNTARKAEGKGPVASTAGEETLLAEAGPITRPDLAFAMVAKGYVRDTRAAFDRYLGDEAGAAAELDGPDFASAIAAIHAAGGIAVLAHPYTIYKYKERPYSFSGKSYRDFDALLSDLLAAGLDGIEQYKANRGPADFIVAHARAFGAKAGRRVLLTPGSDYHGSSGAGQPHFDAIPIPDDMARSILDAFGGKAGADSPVRAPVLAGDGERVESVIRDRLRAVEFDRR